MTRKVWASGRVARFGRGQEGIISWQITSLINKQQKMQSRSSHQKTSAEKLRFDSTRFISIDRGPPCHL